MAASDVEDGEIVGEVNENYEQCISAPEPHAAKHGAAATSAAAAHKQQLPGWEDEQQPAGHVRRKPKKEKKKKHKDAVGGPAEAGDGHDAADAPDSQGQQATYVNVYGSNAAADVEIKAVQPIHLRDVQQLVLWVLGDAVAPRWVFTKNKPLIPQVVLLLAGGLTEHVFNQHKALMPTLASFQAPAVALALNSNVRPGHSVGALLGVPQNRKRKREAQAEAESAKEARAGQPPFLPEHYVLTLREMQQLEYPVPTLGDDGFELTRCTLVDAAGSVLLDELVVPHNPVTDYNTRYSGITAAMLEGVTTRLEDVQRMVKRHVKPHTLLVGHSLDNDLAALKMCHCRVLDTVALFPHPRGPPYKSSLRYLASKYLQRAIQEGEHDSAVDARAAMDLALLKIEKGPSYGSNEAQGVDKLPDVLAATGRGSKCCLVDRQETLTKHATGHASAILVTSDSQAAEVAARQVKNSSWGFVWSQLQELSNFHFERCKARRRLWTAQQLQELQQQEQRLKQERRQQQQTMQQQAKQRHGDMPELRWQQELKYKREQRLDGLKPWSTADEEAFCALTEQQLRALCFCAVKR
ncbi:hypothetical protein OEZ85_011669 [Tetradesmus obliquus]|uniref:Exonuclease domain-containing protein n=1 Tax=Tetradesmus obliquus TaxID=3088 RepID=A0ABY8TR32_TETOB|nr:hypothetical protein OEZ85_011669 [Tetradesmus obliquus]